MKQQSTNIFLRKNKQLFVCVFLFASFLLFYKLPTLMPFIGDQGWFYLSARDMLLTGHIPLVGITSSHTWLHQGPLWTYMLAVALWIGHFNPVAGGYLSALIGLLTVALIYKFGSEIFSQRVGLIACLLYATSPLVIFFARMPYHTSPIPLLTLCLFYCTYQWINSWRFGFPFILLLLALLYNFEIATFMLFPIIGIVLLYGIIKKTVWIKNILNKKILFFSLICLVIPMIPMLIYDIHHGYPQTVKFVAWILYKIAIVFGFPQIHHDEINTSLESMIVFGLLHLERLLFFKSTFISLAILLFSFLNLLFLNRSFYKKKEYLQKYSLLCLFVVIPVFGYIAQRTNSDAYWPVFFPSIIMMIALFIDKSLSFKRMFYPVLGVVFILVFYNVVGLLQSNFLIGANGLFFSKREAVAEKIIGESKGREYNIKGKGQGSQFASFTMNYEYLTWWLGHGPSDKSEHLVFFIRENDKKIYLNKKIIDK